MGRFCPRSLHRPVKQWSLNHPEHCSAQPGEICLPGAPRPAASCVSRGFWLLDLEVHPLHHHPISTVHFFNELNYKTVYNIWATSDELTM